MNDTLNELREKSIKSAYFDVMKSIQKKTRYVSTNEIIQELMKKEAPRFYISFESTRRIISKMHRGIRLDISNKNKLSMFNEIYKRYLEEVKEHDCPNYYILEQIIEQPAPSYYLNLKSMKSIVYKSIKSK